MAHPERIGRYRVSRLLGSGGFASVWLGTDERLDEPVAIKVLADNWATVPDVHNRFLQEARLLRKADSDRVVRMYDLGELPDGRPYFVMSYADRGTVAGRLAGPRLPVPQALHIAVETARAVAVLHRLGVVHRDIKPSNVLVQTEHGGGERFLIGDLGVAKHVAQASGFTIAAGTPGYMAPEQGNGVDVDIRADVYGLGALTYHLLTGSKYGGGGVRGLGLPKRSTQVVARALERDRNRRWPDADSFADALAGIVPDEPPTAIVGGLPAETQDEPTSLSRPPTRRRIAVRLLVLLAVVLLLAGGGALARSLIVGSEHYFVGEGQGGEIAIFQGTRVSVLGVSLNDQVQGSCDPSVPTCGKFYVDDLRREGRAAVRSNARSFGAISDARRFLQDVRTKYRLPTCELFSEQQEISEGSSAKPEPGVNCRQPHGNEG